MAVALTQIITEDRASGAQVIDGSLRFDGSSYLTRTPSSAGNRTTWTWSGWIKRSSSGRLGVWSAGITFGPGSPACALYYNNAASNNTLEWIIGGSTDGQDRTNAYYRDYSSWHHVVGVYESSHATASERFRLFVNGERVTCSPDSVTQSYQADVNNTVRHTIGARSDDGDPNTFYDGYMSQVYFVDGQALDASYFGFTDGLTNTWRPKKYTGTYGTNGFYLPLDGNSLIGEDRSGNGNNWTPVNFGGSNSIEKATGALPILNTVNGGNVAVPGVFGSKVSNNYTVSSSSGGGNPYIFDSAGTQPTFSFIRGATYTFDYSNATSHPLRFSTTSNGTHGGGSEYTDGTTTSGNIHKITVPHNAPDTLYYYCTAHSGMGNSISVTTDEKVADPYAWKNVLALPLVGSAADESNKLNVGSTTKTATVAGSVAASRVENNFYGTSYKFVGSDSIHYGTNADFEFDGDFTIECWAYATATGAQSLFVQPTTGGYLALNIDCNTGFDIYLNNGGAGYTVSKPFTNRWNHVAMVRSGSTITIYLNGVAGTTITNSNTLGSTSQNFSVGGLGTQSTGSYTGYMSDFRIYKGVAKYTSNFIPASTNPDILPDTPSGVAGGSALTSIPDSATAGAVVFDGSDDYLSIGSSNDFEFGSGDFTVEFWFKSTKSSAAYQLLASRDMWSGGGGGTPWFIQLTNSDTIVISGTAEPNAGWEFSNACSVSVARGVWNHVAFTRNGNTLNLYANGIKSADQSFSQPFENSSNDFIIGRYQSGQYFEGFISNFRIVKGTALYTANFTPPTEPLTNVTNTKLLCCQSTTSATAATVSPTSITANGSVASKFSPFMPDNINAVRGQETGYATFNPLQTTAVSSSDTSLTNGNLDISFTASANNYSSYLTQSINSGKFYLEVTINSSTTSSSTIGFVGDNNLEAKRNATASGVPGLQGTYGRGVDGSGIKYNGSGNSEGQYMNAWQQGDVIMVAIDADNDRFYLGKNGRLETTEITFPAGTTKPYHFGVGDSSGSTAASFSLNTGQKPFKYAPPEGYKALCLANLPRPTEVALQPDKYFGTLLYTADVASGKTVTGLNFGAAPDFVWIKNRDNVEAHHLMDVVRGNDSFLMSNLTDAERDRPFADTNDTLAFDFVTNGFSLVSTNYSQGELYFLSLIHI